MLLQEYKREFRYYKNKIYSVMLSKICGIIAFLGMAVLTLIATQYFIRIANFGNGNFSSYILASFKMMVKSLVRWICHVRSYTHWT